MYVFFFKQKTAYEVRISDWSSDVCSSDLAFRLDGAALAAFLRHFQPGFHRQTLHRVAKGKSLMVGEEANHVAMRAASEAVIEALVVVDVEARRLFVVKRAAGLPFPPGARSEERRVGKECVRTCRFRGSSDH